MMTKKHFVRMADVFSEEMCIYIGSLYSRDGADAGEAIARIARAFADMAKADNPAFDRQKFFAACGLDNEGRAK